MGKAINLGIWDKLTKAVVFLLFVAGVLGVCVWYLPLIQQNERMRKEVLRLQTDLKREEELKKNLRQAVEAGLNDARTIERQARESLGYAKPGEVVVRFEDPARSQPRQEPH